MKLFTGLATQRKIVHIIMMIGQVFQSVYDVCSCSKRYHTNISSFSFPFYPIETSSWKLPESVRKAGVKDIKVVDDWLIFMDSDTNLPYKCFNNKINKTWEIHTDPNGRKYYFDPNSGNESVWSIPDEIEHALIEERKMVPEDKEESVPAADLQNEIPNSTEDIAFEQKQQADERQEDAKINEDDMPNATSVLQPEQSEDPAMSVAKRKASAKATEIARVGGVVIVIA